MGEFLDLLKDSAAEQVQADDQTVNVHPGQPASSTREEIQVPPVYKEPEEDFFTFLRHNKGGAFLIVLAGVLWWWFSFMGGRLWEKESITVITCFPGLVMGCALCIGNLLEKMSAKTFFALLIFFVVLYILPVGHSWYRSGNILSDLLIPFVWVVVSLFVWFGMKKDVSLSAFHQMVRWAVLPLLLVSLVIEVYMLIVL